MTSIEWRDTFFGLPVVLVLVEGVLFQRFLLVRCVAETRFCMHFDDVHAICLNYYHCILNLCVHMHFLSMKGIAKLNVYILMSNLFTLAKDTFNSNILAASSYVPSSPHSLKKVAESCQNV